VAHRQGAFCKEKNIIIIIIIKEENKSRNKNKAGWSTNRKLSPGSLPGTNVGASVAFPRAHDEGKGAATVRKIAEFANLALGGSHTDRRKDPRVHRDVDNLIPGDHQGHCVIVPPDVYTDRY
jgi:hypothetical protein